MTEVFENYNIKNESSFRIGGTVKKAAFPSNSHEFIELLDSNEYDMILGNCSNVLFYSGNINKNIIFTKKHNLYKIEDNKIKVSSGTLGSVLSKECLKNNLSGFEFLIGFPGSFGGMIYMNASAHNQSISDCFISAKVYDLKAKETKLFSKEDMHFNYRYSELQKGSYIVLEADFELNKSDYEIIKTTMDKNTEFRKTKQPSLKYGNAGSIFKNPPNDSAGRLLDLCGFKGQKQGGAMVFENHANFIINYDNANSNDVISLMYKMYSKVKESYKIELRPEIKYIGNKETEEYKLWELMATENIQMTQK